LRALIWARTGKLRRATYITSRIGIGFSWLLVALGVWLLVTPPYRWNGFVFVLIGMFLKNALKADTIMRCNAKCFRASRLAT